MTLIRCSSNLGVIRRVSLACLLALAAPIGGDEMENAVDSVHAERELFLQQMFQLGPKPSHFSQGFLAKVPFEKVEEAFASLSNLGEYQNVQIRNVESALVCFSDGYSEINVNWSNTGKIDGLVVTQLVHESPDINSIVKQLMELPGRKSIKVTKNGVTLVSRNSSDALSVGSAFKIAILLAVEDSVASGKLKWNDVLNLHPENKSSPSGIMHTWPDFTGVTVESAVLLMLGLSDNTAADLLISVLGRHKIEEVSPGLAPLITTREYFEALSLGHKSSSDSVAGRSGNNDDRPITDGRDQDRISSGADVGWFLSTDTLIDMIEKVRRKELLAAGPTPFSVEGWQGFAFKGGSGPGFVNMTGWMKDDLSDEYSISITYNDASELDAKREVAAIFASTVALLKRQAVADESCSQTR